MFDSSFPGDSAKYTANTGMVVINTANSGLDGGGTTGDVITAASNGTIIKSVRIEMQTRALQGMVRLFIYDGTNTRLLREIEIPPSVKSSATYPGFSRLIHLNYFLKSGDVLRASTELADTYNVIAEGYDITYP